MNKKTIQHKADEGARADTFLWILAVILLSLGIAASYYFADVAEALKAAGWLLLACVLIFIIALTSKGKQLWKFANEAKIELRKVVWPKREEAVRTTVIVAGLVLLTALILWGTDSILLWLIGILTGQRG